MRPGLAPRVSAASSSLLASYPWSPCWIMFLLYIFLALLGRGGCDCAWGPALTDVKTVIAAGHPVHLYVG